MQDTPAKKIIVTGANGQLGTEFRMLHMLYPDFEFHFLTKLELDIRLENRVKHFIEEFKPAAVINCGAYTNVEKAEDDREDAFLANALAPSFLAEACHNNDALFVHFSTDYVFDGKKGSAYTEEDQVSPINVYGESKLEGERLVDEKCERNILLRVSWLYSTFGHNFYKTMNRLAKERGELKVVGDQYASPTYARHLAHDVVELLDKALIQQSHAPFGLYHYSQDGVASWCDFAKEIVINKGLGVPVYAVTTEAFPTKAQRPAYSKLDNTKFKAAFSLPTPTWKEGLADCIINEQTQEENEH
jgi:dTDP-4-dehydrorhamnose reductase